MDAAGVTARILRSHHLITQSRRLLDRVARELDEVDSRTLRRRHVRVDLSRLATLIAVRRIDRGVRSFRYRLQCTADALRRNGP